MTGPKANGKEKLKSLKNRVKIKHKPLFFSLFFNSNFKNILFNFNLILFHLFNAHGDNTDDFKKENTQPQHQ